MTKLAFHENEYTLAITNGNTEIHFTRDGQWQALKHKEPDFQFTRTNDNSPGNPLWQVIFRSSEGNFTVVEPSGEFSYDVEEQEDQICLKLRWDTEVDGQPLGVWVSVVLRADQDVSLWRAGVQYSGPLCVWELICPRIGQLGTIDGDGSNDFLAIPWQYGGIIPNPMECLAQGGSRAFSFDQDYGAYDNAQAIGKTDSKIAYSYPGMWALQFVAYGNPEVGGIYFAAHDPAARYKRFGFYGHAGSHEGELVMQHYPDERLTPGLDYETPYDTVIALFSGQWWNASAIHREWALEQEWCKKGPLAKRKDIPKWVLDADLWYWNWRPKKHLGSRGMPEDVVPAILELKRMMDVDMAFHWYEWDGERFNKNIPPTFPIPEGFRERLADGINKLHEAGVHAIPYINARLWNMDEPSWEEEGAQEAVCLDQDGEYADIWVKTWRAMCPYTDLWQKKVKWMCDRLMYDYDFDGIYLDQITSCFVVPCFVAQHGHPSGGGNSWYAGYRKMMELIQSDAKPRRPDAAFTSESTIDCYLDLFDANLAREANEISTRHSEQWLPIPLFHSIYHDYAITYGSVWQLTDTHPDAYCYSEALVLAGGQQLMVEGYLTSDVGTSNYQDYLQYMRRLLQARVSVRPHLLYGEWLPPVTMQVDTVDIKWSDRQPPKRDIPAVITSSWGDEDGSICLVFVNHTAETRTIRYELRCADYGIKPGSANLIEKVGEEERVLAENLPEVFEREESFAPRSPRVFIIR